MSSSISATFSALQPRGSTVNGQHDQSVAVLYDFSVETFGERIRHARDARGWSQNEVDRRGGFSAGTTNKWEKEKRGKSPSAEAVARLAKALGVNETWLRTGAGQRDAGAGAPQKLPLDAVLERYPAMLPELVTLLRSSPEYSSPTADEAQLVRLIEGVYNMAANELKTKRKPARRAKTKPKVAVEATPKSKRKTGTE